MQGDRSANGKKAPRLRVLIVDDDARVRRALRSLIECSVDLVVVGEAGSTLSAKRLDLELRPDVVVLDLLLPEAPDGMQVLRELRRRDRPVVAISGMGELGSGAMVAGAHAFLEKHGRGVDDLLDMIRAAHRHAPWHQAGEADASDGQRVGHQTEDVPRPVELR